jgi:hypothetical protein
VLALLRRAKSGGYVVENALRAFSTTYNKSGEHALVKGISHTLGPQ